MNKLKALLKEPLTHFFAIGLVIFALYAYLDRGDSSNPGDIVVDEARVDSLIRQFQKAWQRPPTRPELRGLVDAWIREEILYREGLALRLDEDDPIVRRRIAQKMDFITDVLVPAEPTDEELQEWLDSHPEAYRMPPEYSLLQKYFDPGRHGDGLDGLIDRSLAALATGPADDVAGDTTLLPYRMADVSANQVARVFGEEFADALADLPVGRWSGPVSSAYGLHLVYLEYSEPGREPALDEVRAAVERDLMNDRSKQANEAYYELLREKYNVRVADGLGLAADDRGS